MRLVIFTGRPDLRDSAWWDAIARAPGLERVLVVQRRLPGGLSAVARRFRANVRKHGAIFVPFRVWMAAVGIVRRVLPSAPAIARRGVPAVPVDEIVAPDIHAPDVLERVRAWQPTLGLSLGAPILKPSLFGTPAMGTLNVHQGKVPDFRGAPPAFWELDTGAHEAGATIHWIDEGLDTGDIVDQATCALYPGDSLSDVEARLDELGVELLRSSLAAVASGSAQRTPQPRGGATYRMPRVGKWLRTMARLRLARLRRAARPRNILKSVYFVAYVWLMRPLRDALRTVRGRHRVRIFTYHRVTHLCRDGMTIAPDAFARQLRFIARSHDIVPLSTALGLLERGARLRRPVAVLTFDDAYGSVIRTAFPVMQQLGVTGTCFVPTDLAGTDRRLEHDAHSPVARFFDIMSWQELEALVRGGWELGSHTASHARLSLLDAAATERELTSSRDALRSRFGIGPVVLAYPFGSETDIEDEGRACAQRLGYVACLGDYGGDNQPGMDPFRLHRTELGGDHPTLAWQARVHGFGGPRHSAPPAYTTAQSAARTTTRAATTDTNRIAVHT